MEALKDLAEPDTHNEPVENPDGCSKCEKPLDTSGYPKWCQACRNAYRTEYNRTRKEMSETRGFCAGVSSAKQFIAREFQTKVGGAQLTGHEAAGLVLRCNGPNLPSS